MSKLQELFWITYQLKILSELVFMLCTFNILFFKPDWYLKPVEILSIKNQLLIVLSISVIKLK